jgi:hypothetical protein
VTIWSGCSLHANYIPEMRIILFDLIFGFSQSVSCLDTPLQFFCIRPGKSHPRPKALRTSREFVLQNVKAAAALRINLNVEGCGIVAAPVHAPSRAPLLLPLLLSHNLPLPRVHLCVMGRLVHAGLGSSSLVAHVLNYPPLPPREQLHNRYCSNKHTHTAPSRTWAHHSSCDGRGALPSLASARRWLSRASLDSRENRCL